MDRDKLIREWKTREALDAVADLRHSVEVLERDLADEIDKATRLIEKAQD